jgi:hypothetical protein
MKTDPIRLGIKKDKTMSNQPPPADPNDKNAPQGGNTAPPPAGEQPAAEKEKITIVAPANATMAAIVTPDDDGEPPLVPPTRWQILLLGFFLILIFLLLSYLLLKLWGKQDREPLELFWGLYFFEVSIEVKLLVIAMVAGGMGSIFHAVKSFTSFVGNRRIDLNWFWWYFLRPVAGIVLAAIFYFVLRAGLLAGQGNSKDVSLYGVAAIAALAGMFADQAALKLKEVFETLFKAEDPRTGKLEDGSAAGKPTITAIDKPQVSKGTDADVTVTGTGFITASKVTLAGKAVASTFKSTTALVVNLKAADVPTAGEFDLVVTNPAPGGPSDPKKLKVV